MDEFGLAVEAAFVPVETWFRIGQNFVEADSTLWKAVAGVCCDLK